MAKGRMLNRETSLSIKLNALVNDTTRLLATWTIPHLDKNGVFHADAQVVRSLVFPLRQDISTQEVAAMLDDMERVGLIRRFCAAGRMWQVWPGFEHNQPYLRRDKERTDFPTPPGPVPPNSDSGPDISDKIPTVSRQIPTVDGEKQAQLEVEVEVEEEIEVEEKARDAPATPPGKRISGFAVVHTEHADERVSAYMDILAQKQITETRAALITENVPPGYIDLWREILTGWAIGGDRGPYRADNMAGLFERFNAAKNARRFTKPAPSFQANTRGKPTMLPQVANPSASDFAAAEERARAQRAERAARKAAMQEVSR